MTDWKAEVENIVCSETDAHFFYKNTFEIDFVFQELDDLPPGFAVPAERVKPWGTSHAVLQAESKVAAPFAVINADDFYGYESFRLMADFLAERRNDETLYAVVGFLIDRTLSEYGSVARGICEVGADGWLEGVVERTLVERTAAGIAGVTGVGAVRGGSSGRPREESIARQPNTTMRLDEGWDAGVSGRENKWGPETGPPKEDG